MQLFPQNLQNNDVWSSCKWKSESCLVVLDSLWTIYSPWNSNYQTEPALYCLRLISTSDAQCPFIISGKKPGLFLFVFINRKTFPHFSPNSLAEIHPTIEFMGAYLKPAISTFYSGSKNDHGDENSPLMHKAFIEWKFISPLCLYLKGKNLKWLKVFFTPCIVL